MCEIAGSWSQGDQPQAAVVACSMAFGIAARAPVSSGEWAKDGLPLAQRRLPFIELLPARGQLILNPGGGFFCRIIARYMRFSENEWLFGKPAVLLLKSFAFSSIMGSFFRLKKRAADYENARVRLT